MAESKKAAGKPIVDVAQPGKTAPPQTSKPVLVSNREMLKDPMVVDDTPVPGGITEKEEPSLTKPTEKPDLTPTVEKEIKPDVEEKPTEDEPEKPPVENNEDNKSNDGPPSEASAAAQAAQAEDAEAEARAKHDTEVSKLVESKKYFLPINAVEKRKTKRFVILGIVLSVLLAMAWLDVALDASLIQINGVKAPTHFFSN